MTPPALRAAAARAGVSEQQAAQVARELARAVVEERVFICTNCLGYGELYDTSGSAEPTPCRTCDASGWTGR